MLGQLSQLFLCAVFVAPNTILGQFEGLKEMLKTNVSLKMQVEDYTSRTELDRYAVFYCGNNWDVAKALKAACTRANVSFTYESFGDW
jgi:hypothetical protein